MLIGIALFRNSIVLNRTQKCQFYHTWMLISNIQWNFENSSKSTMSRLNSRITFQHNFSVCIFLSRKLELIQWNWFEFGIILNDFSSYSNSSFIHRVQKSLKSRNSTWQWGMNFFTARSLMTFNFKWLRYDLKMTVKEWKTAQGTYFLVDSIIIYRTIHRR